MRTNPLAENNLFFIEKKENYVQTEDVEEDNKNNVNNGNDMNNMNYINNINDVNNNIIGKNNSDETIKESQSLQDKELIGMSSSPKKEEERPKYYYSTYNHKLEIQPRERFTYFLNTFPKNINNNSSLNYITPIKVNSGGNNFNINSNIDNNIDNINHNLNDNFNNNINENIHNNNNMNEINSISKITNFDNLLDIQQNSDIIGPHEILNNNYQNFFIEDFKKELINENNFMNIAHKNVSLSNIFSTIISKVERVKNVILTVKEKLKKLNKDKKISPHQFIQVLSQLEKYISLIFIQLNQSNGELLSILPTVSIIYNLISKFVYNKSFKVYNDNFKYNFDKNSFNNQIEDIKIDISNTNSSRDSTAPNYQELKQFFDINKKIFSSSELIKYKNIYHNLSMSQIIKVFKETCNNLKKTIHNLRISYKNNASDFSDFDETINSKIKLQQGYTADCDDYRIVNEKILKLKKFEFDFKILMELLKNYFVCFEIIVKKIEKEAQNKNKNKSNLIQLGEEINIIFNLFEDVIYYKMDDLDDDTIFNRKVILKLIQNHKEYLAIVYDLRY